jgi:hypothetical protein
MAAGISVAVVFRVALTIKKQRMKMLLPPYFSTPKTGLLKEYVRF